MALGVPLPQSITATGWWLQGDTKLSKSLGNVVDPLAMKDVYGVDVLRYFLMRDMVIGLDSNFSEEALVRRNNSDLANDLGNLSRRAAGLIGRYFDGKVPEPGAMTEDEAPIVAQATALVEVVRTAVDELKLHAAIEEVMQLVRRLNKYVSDTEPFRTVKTDRAAAARSLYTVVEGLRHAANLLAPVMPEKMPQLLRAIGAGAPITRLVDLKWGDLEAGSPIDLDKGLFPRQELPATGDDAPDGGAASGKARDPRAGAGKEVAQSPGAGASDDAAGATREVIAFDEFTKVDLRVATVLACERVEGSDRLLRFQLDMGDHQRQVVSGVAAHVDPTETVGTQVVLVANLAPRKIFKLQSEGMILTSERPDGGFALLRPGAPAPAGSAVS